MIDAHLHLCGSRLFAKADEVMSVSRTDGVSLLVSCTAAYDDWRRQRALLAAYPDDVVGFFGVHPWYVQDLPDTWQDELALLLDDKATGVGVGEIGLDGYKSDFDLQRKVFADGLAVAAECGKPVVIHCVKAASQVYAALKPFAGKVKFMLHSFNLSLQEMQRFADLGGYFSLSPRITVTNEAKFKALLQAIPAARLLLESDIDTFDDFAGKYSRFLLFTREVALNLNMNYKELERLMEANVKDFLG